MHEMESFVTTGLEGGEGVVVIATADHRRELEDRLEARGIDLLEAVHQGRYLPLDAERTLSSIMFRGWPDGELLKRLISPVVARAGRDGRRVRKFGEMASLLVAEGYYGAAVHLESLWHQLAETMQFSQCCAYPHSLFPPGEEEPGKAIAGVHTRVLP